MAIFHQHIDSVYAPGQDYWRLLRLQIAAHHQFIPGPGLDALDTAIDLAHPDRKRNYEYAVSQYRALIEGRDIEFLSKPRRGIMGDIVVNPEMQLKVDGVDCVVKFYIPLQGEGRPSHEEFQTALEQLQQTHGHLGRPFIVDLMYARALGLVSIKSKEWFYSAGTKKGTS